MAPPRHLRNEPESGGLAIVTYVPFFFIRMQPTPVHLCGLQHRPRDDGEEGRGLRTIDDETPGVRLGTGTTQLYYPENLGVPAIYNQPE